MIEQYLTKDEIRGLFKEGAASYFIDKELEKKDRELEKKAVLSDLLKSYLWLIPAGAGVGALAGALGHGAMQTLSGADDPEEDFYDEQASIFDNRTKELDDASWMQKVRAMRADLKRNGHKMSDSEYRVKYNALKDALSERKG